MELKKEFKWIERLIKAGYTYFLAIKDEEGVVYATREEPTSEGFAGDVAFDTIMLEEGEKYLEGDEFRNVFMKLGRETEFNTSEK